MLEVVHAECRGVGRMENSKVATSNGQTIHASPVVGTFIYPSDEHIQVRVLVLMVLISN